MAFVGSTFGFQPEMEPSSLTKINRAGAEVLVFCHLEELRAIEHDSSRIPSFSVSGGRRNRHDQRTRRAVLRVKGGNTGAIVADPNRAVWRDCHTPRINKVFIDVLRYTRDVGLEVCPRVSVP